MREFEIQWGDWQRILLGNMPAAFFVEILIRVLFVFLLIIICMRLMGKRMAAQLNRNELVAMSALAAATGLPLQAPDRGLLPAFIVAMVVVGGQRLIASLAARRQDFERLTQGYMNTLVEDGHIMVKTLADTRISRDRLLAELRCRGFKHLGEISRVYFEAGGAFTIVPAQPVQPGLSILPEVDDDFREQQPKDAKEVCMHCGQERSRGDGYCSNCHNNRFEQAITA